MPELRKLLDQAHGLFKTDLYTTFESAMREAFAAQLRTSRYDVQFQFRTIDETNLYRSLYPTLIERGAAKSPGEAGSGVRNLLVLALFYAFAHAFKGGAVVGIEEPELFLHPHAQRSLMGQFESLVAEGNQLFISTHSATFLESPGQNASSWSNAARTMKRRYARRCGPRRRRRCWRNVSACIPRSR